MSTLTITAKGQITLNKALLRHLGLKPGDRLEIAEQPDRRLTVFPAAPARTGRMSDAFGMLHREGMNAISVEEMNEAIKQSRTDDDEKIMTSWRSNHE